MTGISDRLKDVSKYPSELPGALTKEQLATVTTALEEPTASPAAMRQAERLLGKALNNVAPVVSRRAALDGYGNPEPTFRKMLAQETNLDLLKWAVEQREPFGDKVRHAVRDCVVAPILNAFSSVNGAMNRFASEL